MMTDDLSGRVLLVTGASGIAAAGARLFGRSGASVFVVSRTADKCERLCDDVTAEGGICSWTRADLTIEDEADSATELCLDRFGRIDGLFAVAGGSGRRFGDGPVHEIPLAGWEETLRLNGHPAFLAARNAVRVMRMQEPNESRSRGSIVIVSSVLAAHPVPSHFATHAYAAVKGAEISLTTAMASYYAGDGIRVNAIAPGLIRTPMAERAAEDPVIVAYAARKQPLAGGLIEADEVASAAGFLLSDRSRQITGQVLAVDGGWSVVEAAP
ncbi:MAG: SDR family oxidoreductase [Actinomycetota bacterium]|nr:SDR family oxidoreductase [Actinomycetota bacterium]